MKRVVKVVNNVTNEIIFVLEFSGHFTCDRYKELCTDLHRLAAGSYEYGDLAATVYDGTFFDLVNRRARPLHRIDCVAEVNGSTIMVHIFVDAKHVRTMTIAC